MIGHTADQSVNYTSPVAPVMCGNLRTVNLKVPMSAPNNGICRYLPSKSSLALLALARLILPASERYLRPS